MGLLEKLQRDFVRLHNEFHAFKEETNLWKEDIGDDIKGNEAASKFLSIGVTKLLQIRESFELLDRFEGKTPIYSRTKCVEYKRRHGKGYVSHKLKVAS